MILAQALGEYGALSGGAFLDVASALSTIEDTVRDAEPHTWILSAAGLFVLWFIFLRR